MTNKKDHDRNLAARLGGGEAASGVPDGSGPEVAPACPDADSRWHSNQPASPEIKPGELLPCPFCGGGESRLDVNTYWTGMRSAPVSFTIRHWCLKGEDVLATYREVRAKTREAAIIQYNQRSKE